MGNNHAVVRRQEHDPGLVEQVRPGDQLNIKLTLCNFFDNMSCGPKKRPKAGSIVISRFPPVRSKVPIGVTPVSI